MKIEGSFCSVEDSLLGLMTCVGEDENGEFSMVSIGFLFFEFSLIIYK